MSDATDADLRGEFEAIRARLPTPWGRFVWPRLIVLPHSFARFRKVTGGACVWWFWVVADPALADAPADARHFVLAHEWGHVARGHAARLLAFWTLCFPLVWVIWAGVQEVLNPSRNSRRPSHSRATRHRHAGGLPGVEPQIIGRKGSPARRRWNGS